MRKGWQQFTTLSDVLSEFGPPRQYFMLVPKAFDNTYPYLLHADGKSIADPDANQPPAFVYKMVSSPLEETMDVCEGRPVPPASAGIFCIGGFAYNCANDDNLEQSI